MLAEGNKAPDFSLPDSDGKTRKLGDYKGKNVVLYFYPKDDTPGCTIEAKDFTRDLDEVHKLNAEVLGVSSDTKESHCDFNDKYSLKVTLLSDPESKTIKDYEAYGNKGVFGWGTIRKTYVIGKDGKILKIYPKVQAIGHSREVIEFLKTVK
ncbi:MAG TPA: peroxiredoxin [Candidatus Acidoferrales bacterium]|nr:peroxiredoxin [Candidatus Acidoferrales bacterium]